MTARLATEGRTYQTGPTAMDDQPRMSVRHRTEAQRRARCVPDQAASDGVSAVVTVTGEHALTWTAAAQTVADRSLPSWD